MSPTRIRVRTYRQTPEQLPAPGLLPEAERVWRQATLLDVMEAIENMQEQRGYSYTSSDFKSDVLKRIRNLMKENQ